MPMFIKIGWWSSDINKYNLEYFDTVESSDNRLYPKICWYYYMGQSIAHFEHILSNSSLGKSNSSWYGKDKLAQRLDYFKKAYTALQGQVEKMKNSKSSNPVTLVCSEISLQDNDLDEFAMHPSIKTYQDNLTNGDKLLLNLIPSTGKIVLTYIPD